MQKIKIRLPATLTDFGPGIGSLGLALGLYTNVELSARDDEQLIVETLGEGAGQYAIGLRHPVVLALIRVFQKLERAPLGITIKIENQIPLNSGLGAEAAFMVAGVIGANNLMDNPFTRQELIQLAATTSQQSDQAITSILGGFTASLLIEDEIIYRTLSLEPFKIIVAVPDVTNYASPERPERVDRDDALHNLHRVPLFMEALHHGDMTLLIRVLDDKLHTPFLISAIPGYAHVAEVARLAGALAVTTSGKGPAMVFLAESGHDRIVEVVETAFKNIDTPARVHLLSTDTQGVVISMMQSSN